MVYERGPSQPSEMPMPPRVVAPGRFLALASELAPLLGTGEDVLGAVVTQLAPLTQRDLSPAFNALVGPAFESIGQLEDATDGATYAGVLDGFRAGTLDLDGQRAELPGPDASEPLDASDQPFEPQPAGPPAGDGDDPATQD